MFINKLKQELVEGETNYSYTDKDALVYSSSGQKLLDLNFATSSLRKMPQDTIIDLYMKAFYENRKYAIKWLFFLMDVRGGYGERRSSRVILKYLASNFPQYIRPFIKYIPFFNRWDAVLELLDTPLKDDVVELLKEQLLQDYKNMKANKPVSLCAKWLPRTDATNLQRKSIGKQLAELLDDSNVSKEEKRKAYNHMLKILRKHIVLVETQMTQNKWSEIDYSAVPSKANMKYSKAFIRNDEERRQAFLEKAKKGEVKVNASTLYPYEIVHKYEKMFRVNDDLEVMWKNLKNTLADYEDKNVIVVADGSGSMCYDGIGKSDVTALTVANSIALYFAERLKGELKDYYITFSNTPKLVHLNGKNLRENLDIIERYDECANTNIYKVFKLILDTAQKNYMKQEELPNTILIISDMQFDACSNFSTPLFVEIQKEYRLAGLKLPRLVFWNVCGRIDTIPITSNDYGFALVSGFSPNIVKMVMSDKLDPLECLLETLDDERYDVVDIDKLSIDFVEENNYEKK